MASLHIRKLPENIYFLLKQRAEAEHRSIAQEAILLLAKGLDTSMIENDECCLDTSVGVEMVLKKESSALFKYFIAEADLVNAPMLLITDATNVFWKYQKFSEIPYAEMPLTCCRHSARRAFARSCRIQLFFESVNPPHKVNRCPTALMNVWQCRVVNPSPTVCDGPPSLNRRGLSSLILDSATSPSASRRMTKGVYLPTEMITY